MVQQTANLIDHPVDKHGVARPILDRVMTLLGKDGGDAVGQGEFGRSQDAGLVIDKV